MQALLDEKTAMAAESAAQCAVVDVEAEKEAASLAGINGGIESDEGKPVLPEVHQGAVGVLKSDNIDWISNARGINGSGNFAGANFIHYENLGYDFMFGTARAGSRSCR